MRSLQKTGFVMLRSTIGCGGERFFVRDFEGWFLAVVRAVVRVVIRGFDNSLCHGCFNGSATRGRKLVTNTGGVARFT